MIITMLGVQQFMPGLMTLTLLQGHRYVRIINWILFLDSCPLKLRCLVAMHIKMIKHTMLCVTGVYLRDTTNTIFVILQLNLSHLSICCSFLVYFVLILKFS